MTVWRGFLLTLLALLLWSFGIEPGWLQQRQLLHSSPHWRGAPLTVAVAADWHVGAPHVDLAAVRRIVGSINQAAPDLILLPGDFVIQGVIGGTQIDPEAIARELAALRAPLGVYATLGNHDWWLDGARVRRALEQAGIHVIENGSVRIERPGNPFWLLAVGDDMTGHAHPEKALAALPPEVDVIAMMHDPASAPSLDRRVAMAVAGHTHGGQVRLPFWGALLTPGRAPRSHAYGWLEGLEVPTYVTSGIGTSILPVRFNCPPETIVVRLSPATPS